MRRVLLAVTLIVGISSTGFAQKAAKAHAAKGVAVAFFDQDRLQTPAGQDAMRDFEYFFAQINQVVKRDFPNVRLRILARGELLHLPNGVSLNVQNMQPEIGYVLSAPGKKHRVLTGVQTEADFACAAAKFFRGRSASCPK
jgi:hypothetical protein